MLVRHHALCGLLRHQETAISADRDRVRDVSRDEIDERSARAAAGVVDDEVGRADLALDQAKQALDFLRLGGVAGIGLGAGLEQSAPSFSILRAASATRMPCADSSRASEALRPSPAPTMRAILYFGCSMSGCVISRGQDAADLCIRRADNQPRRSQFRRANCSFTAIMPP